MKISINDSKITSAEELWKLAKFDLENSGEYYDTMDNLLEIDIWLSTKSEEYAWIVNMTVGNSKIFCSTKPHKTIKEAAIDTINQALKA